MPNQITQPNEIDAASAKRTILLRQGHTPEAVDAVLYGHADSTPYIPNVTELPSNPNFAAAMHAFTKADNVVKHIGEDTPELLGALDQKDLTGYFALTPDTDVLGFNNVRETWRKVREETAISAVQTVSDGQSLFMNKLQSILGSTPAQITMGGVEPLARAQQVLYGALSGEGRESLARWFPKVVVDEDTDKEISPFTAAKDLAFGGEDNWEANKEQLVNVNADYANTQLLEFTDVVDAWAGEENMDEVYAKLNESGWIGKLGMAGLATTYSMNEVFLDPLFLLERVPVALVGLGRKAAGTAVKSRRAAQVATKYGRFDDLQDAKKAADVHLDNAFRRHQIEGNEHSFKRLQQAERNLTERMDALTAVRDPGEFDTFVPGVPRTNPEAIATQELATLPFEISKPKMVSTPHITRPQIVRDLRKRLDIVAEMRTMGMPEDLIKEFQKDIVQAQADLTAWDAGVRPLRRLASEPLFEARQFVDRMRGKDVPAEFFDRIDRMAMATPERGGRAVADELVELIDEIGAHRTNLTSKAEKVYGMDLNMVQLTFKRALTDIRADDVVRTKEFVRAIDSTESFLKADLEMMRLKEGREVQVAKLEDDLRKLGTHRRRAIDEGIDSMPEVLTVQGRVIRTRTVDEVAAIRKAERAATAARPSTHYQPRVLDDLQGDLFEDTELAGRMLGPDDAEVVGEGLGRLATGAEIDDIMLPSTATPEASYKTGGRIVPGTVDGMVDYIQLEKTLDKMRKAQHYGPNRVLRDKDGHVIDAKLRQASVYEDAKRLATGDKLKFDDSWLPAPRKTANELMESGWRAQYGSSFGDRISSSLYPDTWRVRPPAPLMGYMVAREPMRVLEAMDPGRSWPILRNTLRNTEAETTRLQGVFHGALEDFGALTQTKPDALQKAILTNAPTRLKVSKRLNEELFDILETPRDTKMYAKLTEGLSGKQRKAVETIRNELDLVSDRLGVTGTDKFVDGYITHAFDRDWFEKGGVPANMRGMGRSGHVFLASLLNRSGEKGYVKDATAALDLYSRGVARKIHLEPGLKQVKGISREITKKRKNFWYDMYTNHMISQLKGEASGLGQLVDSTVGAIVTASGKNYRPGATSRKLMGLASLAYASVLSGNPRYPIMSVATALATTGTDQGMFRTFKGMFASATPEGQALFKATGGDQLWNAIFESGSAMDEAMQKLTRGASKIRLGQPSIEDTENFIRGMTFAGSVDEAVSKAGFSSLLAAEEAGYKQKILFDALRTTEEVNHYFGVGAKPPIFSKLSKSGAAVATQFLSFGPKQTEQILAMTRQNPGKIMSYMMLSGWVTRVAAQDLGIDLTDYTGFGYLRQAGVRDLSTPGLEYLWSGLKMHATMTDLMLGGATEVDANKAVTQHIKSIEGVIPTLGFFRTKAKSYEALETGEQRVPGVGLGREIDLEMGVKGARGEMVGTLTGARTVQERLHQSAKAKINDAEQKAVFERYVLAEKAWKMLQDGDETGMRQQLQRLVEMGVPIGDLSDPMTAKAEAARLHWHIVELMQNPGLAHIIKPIMKEHGILGGNNE